jgi:hypothetical protein
MFATRYFANAYFAPRYFPKVGADGAPVTGGPVWVWVNGASQPPGTQVQGTQDVWMCVNGAWFIPAKLTAPWPRRAREDN